MKELKEYAQLSDWLPSTGDQFRLYELAMADVDRASAREVMGISDSHFRVIYKNLKDNFVMGVLNSPAKKESRINQLHHQVRQQYASAMLLIWSEKKDAGIPLAKATLRKAEKYGLYEVAIDLVKELKRFYGATAVNKKQYDYFSEKHKSVLNELLLSQEAEDLLVDYVYALKCGKPTTDIEARIDGLDNIESKSWRFNFMKYLMRVFRYQVAGDESNMLRVCGEALQHFEPYEEIPYIVRFNFFYTSIAIHISKKEFSQAEIVINQCLEYPATGRHNWHIIQFFRAISGFHSEKPAIAHNSYIKVSNIPKKFRTDEWQERFRLIAGFLYLYDYDLVRPMRLGRYLNSFNIVSQDKSGLNVTLIVLELMHLLKAGKLERFNERCESLNSYIQDHLKDKKSLERCVSFLRAMQCIIRGGYRPEDIRKKAKQYLGHLKSTRPQISAETIEIVPFEKLFEMALGFLKG